ncbi:MAG TPA: hypothetical protein VGJ02_04975, partial [Pyrinomonadaceae bacterium]
LRTAKRETLTQTSSMMFPVKDALMFSRWTSSFGGSQGASFFTAPNPAYGATFTYYLKEAPQTLKQKRQEAERRAEREKQSFHYPSIAEIRAETEETPPTVIFTVADPEGKIVRRMTAPATAGIQRATWDLRYTPPIIRNQPAGGPGGRGGEPADPDQGFGNRGPEGPLVMPGKYTVSMAVRVNGVTTPVAGQQSFSVTVEGREGMSATDLATLSDFQRKVSALQRSVSASTEVANEAKTRIGLLKRSAQEAPVDNAKLVGQAETLDNEIDSIINSLRGGREDSDIPPPAINARVSYVADRIRLSSVKPSPTQMQQYDLSRSEFEPVLAQLRRLVDLDLPAFEKELDAAGAPLVPGQLAEP